MKASTLKLLNLINCKLFVMSETNKNLFKLKNSFRQNFNNFLFVQSLLFHLKWCTNTTLRHPFYHIPLALSHRCVVCDSWIQVVNNISCDLITMIRSKQRCLTFRNFFFLNFFFSVWIPNILTGFSLTLQIWMSNLSPKTCGKFRLTLSTTLEGYKIRT